MRKISIFYSYIGVVFLLAASMAACGQSNQAKKPGQASISGHNTESKTASAADQDIKKLSAKELVQRRDDLQAKIKTLADQIFYLNDLIKLRTEKEKAPKGPLSILGGNAARMDQLNSKISQDEDFAGLAQGEAMTANLPDEIKKRKAELDAKGEEFKSIETQMNYKVDIDSRELEFKTNISLMFSGIVALVIVGFFVVAFSSLKVKEEIFAGPAGIQFITLFSLVIAIILFGITGVLEGKELSALLGGLAGYILGRTGVGAGGTASASRTPSGTGTGGAASGTGATTTS